jgi:hypothetical protein
MSPLSGLKMLGDVPNGMFNNWPPNQFLSDLADIADVKGFGDVIRKTAGVPYQYQWGSYYELYVAKQLKSNGQTISELRMKLTKDITGVKNPTDLDIVVNGGQKVYQIKYSVKAFAPKSKYDVGTLDWINDAKKAQKSWIAQARAYNKDADIYYAYQNGPTIPNELQSFLVDSEKIKAISQIGSINGN